MALLGDLAGAFIGNALSKGDRNAAKRAYENYGRTAEGQMNVAGGLNTQGTEDYAFYKDTYRPVETALVQDAMTGQDPEQMAQRAAVNFGQNYDAAQAANEAGLRRMGVNPNSGRFAATRTSDLVRRAAAETEVENVARLNAQDTNFARRSAVADLGGRTASRAISARGGAVDAYGAAGRAYGAIGGYHSNRAAQTQRAVGKMIGGVEEDAKSAMKMFGIPGFADGGPVDGPGTETSDSILAMLSDGEYVIPAHVVRAKGTEFFDKIVQGVK